MITRVGSRSEMIRRLALLYGGLIFGGFSLAMFVQADLGLDPWNVLHQGISEISGRTIGTVVIASSAVVLLLWIPLRQKPGLGTLSDVVVVGIVIDLSLRFMPSPGALGMRLGLLAVTLVLTGLATSLYLGARMGPGPRDGLMTRLAARGLAIRRARIGIDLSVLAVGSAFGGSVGIGTVASALIIGPIVGDIRPRILASNSSSDHIKEASSEVTVALEPWKSSIGQQRLATITGGDTCD